jgi:hypothetical protein
MAARCRRRCRESRLEALQSVAAEVPACSEGRAETTKLDWQKGRMHPGRCTHPPTRHRLCACTWTGAPLIPRFVCCEHPATRSKRLPNMLETIVSDGLGLPSMCLGTSRSHSTLLLSFLHSFQLPVLVSPEYSHFYLYSRVGVGTTCYSLSRLLSDLVFLDVLYMTAMLSRLSQSSPTIPLAQKAGTRLLSALCR